MLEKLIDRLRFLFAFTRRGYRFSISESRGLADQFFGKTRPIEVVVPAELKSNAIVRLAVRKFDLTFNGRDVKIFYSVDRWGRFGHVYTDGINLNITNTTQVVALKQAEFWRRFKKCGNSFNCALALLKQLEDDCETKKDAENCWYCTRYGGGQPCDFL